MKSYRTALLILLLLLLSLALVSCFPEDAPCNDHTDVDNNGYCDKCGTEYEEPDGDPVPDVSGISLPSLTTTYDGTKKSLEYVGKLPIGVQAIYEGNGKTTAGVYTVRLRFYYTKDGALAEIPDSMLEAKLEITRAQYDMTGIMLAGKTFTYDGEEHSLELIGREKLPPSVTYKITGDNKTEVGEYKVTASFVGDEMNYQPIPDMEATLVIAPASITGITFGDGLFTYDGEAKSIFVTGAPSHVEVEYDGNGMTDAGEYTVTATFKVGENYNPIAPMTAKIKILPKKLTAPDVRFTYTNVAYDGEPHTIVVEGVPDTLTYSLSMSDLVAIGEYDIVVSFAAKDAKNYLPPDPITVKMTISISDYVTEGVIYNEVAGGYEVVGYEGTDKGVILPDTYLDKPIVSIASGAFADNTSIIFVVMPKTVKNVGTRAFSGCTSLASVTLGDVEAIGQEAFKNTAITELVLPDTLLAIGFGALEGVPVEKLTVPFIGGSHHSSNTHLGFIFGAANASANDNYITSLTELTISDAAREIPAYALMNLSGLKSVTIGRTVSAIGIGAFRGCTGLKDLYIPSSVTRIDASSDATASAFFGCSPELMLVFETGGTFGKYHAHVSAEQTAFTVYGKSYDEYLNNKDSFRESDADDATLAGIFLDGKLISDFNKEVTDYTIDVDIYKGFGIFSYTKASDVARVESVVHPTEANGYKYVVKVVSGNESATKTYTVTCNVKGVFTTASSITNKGGTEGTVIYVIDDGYKPTATYTKEKLKTVSNLAISYAIATKNFGELKTEVGVDGITRYVMDENGKYTYTENQTNIDFWRDILTSASGRTEIVSHTHTHAPWGYNDVGGSFIYTNSGKVVVGKNMVEGTLTKEFDASKQIIEDIFSEYGSKGLAMVTAGINQSGSDVTTTADTTLKLDEKVVRLTADTAVTVNGGVYTLTNDTVVLLNPINITLPAGTAFTTSATVGATLPKDTAITITKASVVLPAGTVIPGYSDLYYQMHADRIAAGELIGSRLTGQKVYDYEDFANEVYNRMRLKGYMIVSSTDNDASKADPWIAHIDNALKAGGIAAFCIHAIVDDVNAENGQGGHEISKAQADRLFAYTESLGDRVWVATLTDAMLYHFEWSTAKVTSDYEDGKITVTLTDKENDEIFNMPLTVKVRVPGTWSVATDGTHLYEIMTDSYGNKYILAEVAPETTVTITAAN